MLMAATSSPARASSVRVAAFKGRMARNSTGQPSLKDFTDSHLIRRLRQARWLVRWHSMAWRRTSLAGLLILTLAGVLLAQFPRRVKTAPAAGPVQFDYYTLSLSWAPEFCAQPGAAAGNREECATGEDIGFVV